MSIILTTVADHFHPIWTNVFFYLFTVSAMVFAYLIRVCTKRLVGKNDEMKTLQAQHAAKMEGLRKDHNEIVEGLRVEMLKKEEERTRQWMESEKEVIQVLNGISEVLELSDDLSKLESNEILTKIDEIKEVIESKCDKHEENRKTKGV